MEKGQMKARYMPVGREERYWVKRKGVGGERGKRGERKEVRKERVRERGGKGGERKEVRKERVREKEEEMEVRGKR